MDDDVETILWKQVDRKRGILTKDDREYLLGEKSVEGQDEINHRYRIRQRIIQSFLDLVLIRGYLGKDDLKQIANDDRIVNSGVESALATLSYELLYWAEDVTHPIDSFEKIVGNAVLSKTSPEEIDGRMIEESAQVNIEIEQREVSVDVAVTALFSAVDGGEIPQEEVDRLVSSARRLTEATEETDDEEAIRLLLNHMIDRSEGPIFKAF